MMDYVHEGRGLGNDVHEGMADVDEGMGCCTRGNGIMDDVHKGRG